jgi:hypothetical protein
MVAKYDICKCGHFKHQHNDAEYTEGLISVLHIIGHGPCKLCGCTKFTWVGAKEL